MRPTFLFGCLWALWACAHACAQSPQQRPSALRDASVVTRAAPPTTLSPSHSQSSSAPNVGQAPPTDFPVAPAYDAARDSRDSPRETTAALSDRAWTGSPTQGRASGRLSDVPVGQTPSKVMPAQYTSNNAMPAVDAQVRPANHQATVAGAPAHEPKPLKPPTSSASREPGKGSTGTVQMFVSVLSSLAIVIGLILAAAWFYRKAAPTISGALPKQVVQVLGRTPLAPRQQLVLLRLGAKLVLVSNLHGDVRTISEITDPLEVDRLSGLCEAAQPGSISESFRSVLNNMGRNG